ncbi:MAG: hypothetical protein V3V52_08140 [Candidatus Adiutricales bacterium]
MCQQHENVPMKEDKIIMGENERTRYHLMRLVKSGSILAPLKM